MMFTVTSLVSKAFNILQSFFLMLTAQITIFYESINYLISKLEIVKDLPAPILNIENPKFDNSSCYLKHTDMEIDFKLENSILVITDIINSTSLYNESPLPMRQSLDIHRNIIKSLKVKYNGHIVADEGDSYYLVFETARNAINFCIEFVKTHNENIKLFKVRIGINKGKLIARKLCGYKVFGEPVNVLLSYLRHNCGSKICINNRILEKYKINDSHLFCKHVKKII